MNSIRQWLQDWSDACEYANECWPDLSFFAPHEPYTALAAIAAACALFWSWNERGIRRRLQAGALCAARGENAGPSLREFERLVDEMKDAAPAREKQAA